MTYQAPTTIGSAAGTITVPSAQITAHPWDVVHATVVGTNHVVVANHTNIALAHQANILTPAQKVAALNHLQAYYAAHNMHTSTPTVKK